MMQAEADQKAEPPAMDAGRERELGFAVALRALARREHSSKELRLKMRRRGVTESTVDEVLCKLQQEGLQSDERFTEIFVRSRIERGQGELRIRADLRNKGIFEADADRFFPQDESHWNERAADVVRRRFLRSSTELLARYQTTDEPLGSDESRLDRELAAELYAERRKLNARMARFLASRGFSSGVSRRAIDGLWEEVEQ